MHRITPVSAAVAAFTFAAVAEAHPRLVAASPAAGAHGGSPAQLQLSFTEPLIGRFSQLSLADAAGRTAPVAPTQLSADRKQMFAPIRARLAPGIYRVTWRAVSTDTHRVQGSYSFAVVR